MLSVPVTRIPDEGSLEEDKILDAAALGLGAEFSAGEVVLHWELSRRGRQVLAKGRAEALVRLDCSRCLEPFERRVAADFWVDFEPAGEPGEKDGLKPQDSDSGAVFYRGQEVPLGEEIRQELELQVPFQPLCRPGCQGLCPGCGANRNQGACACPGGANANKRQIGRKWRGT